MANTSVDTLDEINVVMISSNTNSEVIISTCVNKLLLRILILPVSASLPVLDTGQV